MITAHGQEAWAGADAAGIGTGGVIHAELLCEAVDVHPGEQVLDVAAGDGAAGLAAARRGADVIATDLIDHVLQFAARVAEASCLPLRTQVADPQDLPFDDDTFDVVLSSFGTMFAPDQQRVADELVRVCRPCGRIGLVSWSPVSLVADLLRATASHVQSSSVLNRAVEWGSEDRLRQLFGNRVRPIRVEPRRFTFRYRSAEHILESFRDRDGPIRAALDSLGRDGQAALAADLIQVFRRFNRADDGTLVAPSHYLEIVAVVR